VASLSQGRTAAAQCGLFTHKSVPVIFEPPCIIIYDFMYIPRAILVDLKIQSNGSVCGYTFILAVFKKCGSLI